MKDVVDPVEQLLALVPSEPDFRFDAAAVTAAAPWLPALAACPQDAVHHGEGDVLVHTLMVARELAALPGYRRRADRERRILFLAALLHDVGKPDRTRTEGERITSRGHSARGETIARRLLYEAGHAPDEREAICALIRSHQLPFFLVDDEKAPRRAHLVSQRTPMDLLAVLTEADARGRVCQDLDPLLFQIGLFTELCAEEKCLEGPRAFSSDHARFLYFRDERRRVDAPAFDDTRCELTLLSGLPGSGKDSWVAEHAGERPIVSLDAIRREDGVDPEDAQGPVVARARELAREHFRASRDFVWNATNLSRDVRSRIVDLAASYGARIRIVHVEVPAARLRRQNREREHPVPESVMGRLLDRWDPPDASEAHRVELATAP